MRPHVLETVALVALVITLGSTPSMVGCGDDLVIDVGDVARVNQAPGAIMMPDQPGERVEHHRRPGIADMRPAINRRSTHIHGERLCRRVERPPPRAMVSWSLILSGLVMAPVRCRRVSTKSTIPRPLALSKDKCAIGHPAGTWPVGHRPCRGKIGEEEEQGRADEALDHPEPAPSRVDRPEHRAPGPLPIEWASSLTSRKRNERGRRRSPRRRPACSRSAVEAVRQLRAWNSLSSAIPRSTRTARSPRERSRGRSRSRRRPGGAGRRRYRARSCLRGLAEAEERRASPFSHASYRLSAMRRPSRRRRAGPAPRPIPRRSTVQVSGGPSVGHAVTRGPAAARKVAVPPNSASVAETRRYFAEDPDAPIGGPKRHGITSSKTTVSRPGCRTIRRR